MKKPIENRSPNWNEQGTEPGAVEFERSEKPPGGVNGQKANISVYLELTREDVEVLKRALNVRLDELRHEVIHTDDRSYKEDLRHELDCLEKIDRELEGEPPVIQNAR